MDIVFNPKAGEIYGLFTSLHFGWNIDSFEKYVETFGVALKSELKEEYLYIHKVQSSRKEQMDFFFNDQSEIFRFFMVFEQIWESKSIEEYINFVQEMSASSLKVMLVKNLVDNKLKNEDEYIEDIAKSDEKLLQFIKKLDVDKAAKWDLYCFAENIEKYKEEFIELMEEYIPIYHKLLQKQGKFIDEVNHTIAEGVNKEGIEFLKEYANNYLSFDQFKKIYFTSSYFDSYLIYFTLREKTVHCYLVVGVYYNEVASQNDSVEAQLKVFKNLSDKTRFGIIKYILEEKRYGQEIAEKFNISNASVSYHMNNLLLLNLVEISKQDNKVFYKFNKKKISETIKFLQDELRL